MRLIDADAFYKDICDALNEMTRIGIAVDSEWLWGKLNDALENAPTIKPQPQWISVTERLPQNNRCVLVTIGNDFEFGKYEDGEWSVWVDEHWDECDDKIITAWMPLPKPYKESE